jgi:HPt (histidine-containing phosphotransfer) domain-containing protein
MPSPQESLHPAQLQELRELLDEDFVPLLETYLRDCTLRLGELRSACSSGDNQAGYEAIHALKGASANIGAVRLAELCLKLQNACRAGHLADNQVLVDLIADEQTRVSHQLRQIIADA